jgi:hypothetical protein
MQSEPIFILNTKVFALEKYGSYITINFPEGRKAVHSLEALGQPFSIITKSKVDKMNPLADTSEFKELANSIPLASTLEAYLREADIDITLSRREDNIIQYLGIAYGKSARIDVITSFNNSKKDIIKNIVPCQFYLIQDKL